MGIIKKQGIKPPSKFEVMKLLKRLVVVFSRYPDSISKSDIYDLDDLYKTFLLYPVNIDYNISEDSLAVLLRRFGSPGFYIGSKGLHQTVPQIRKNKKNIFARPVLIKDIKSLPKNLRQATALELIFFADNYKGREETLSLVALGSYIKVGKYKFFQAIDSSGKMCQLREDVWQSYGYRVLGIRKG